MKFEDYKVHDSIRGWFGRALYFEMQKDEDIFLITADLGFGLWDQIRNDFPHRFYNVGASEQCAVGVGVGLALEGKKPFVFSITTFLIYRAFEWHRNYLNHEKIPVMLIGSGYQDDYKHDGISHQPSGLFGIDGLFETQLWNIQTYFPDAKEEVPVNLGRMIKENQPAFMCLRR
jgi:transketolase